MNVVSLISQLAEQDIRLWLEEGNLRYSAPEGAMTPEVIARLRAAKTDIVAFLQQSESSQHISLPQANRNEPLAVSYAQQRLWFIHQLDPGNTAYHIHAALNIQGQLDSRILSLALSEIIRRHEILRTRYQQSGGKLLQLIAPASDFTLTATVIQPDERDAALQAEIRQPFALDQPIFRVRLWQTGTEQFTLAFTIHHIAADGWSLGIFVNELVQLYTAFSRQQPSPLADLTRQYADYALWQSQHTTQHEAQLAYWQQQLTNVPNLSLPYDTPPSPYLSNEGAAVALNLSRADMDGLQQLNKRHGTTLFMSLLAGLSVLLQRYSQQEDFCIGTPIAGRSIGQLEPMIGCFLNVLAIRCLPRQTLTFSEYLLTIKETCRKAFANQDLPFERIVQELVKERDLAINPLFQVLLSVQNAPITALETPDGLRIQPIEDTIGAAQFDLKLTAREHPEQLELLFEYKKSVFHAATIERMASHLVTLLRHLIRQPDTPMAQADVFSTAEKHQLLGLDNHGWNATTHHWPVEDTLLSLFSRQVQRQPQATAVSCPNHALSYQQLDQRSNQLAHYLQQQHQLQPGSRVLVCLPANTHFLLAVLAIIKSGCCYVPVDIHYPDERIQHIASVAEAAFIISDTEQGKRFSNTVNMEVVLPLLASQPVTAPAIAIKPGDAIYAIFTSGSTGEPKGVEVLHQGENQLLNWYNQAFQFNAHDKCLVVSATGFDLTQKNLFAPLCTGGEVVFHGLDYYEPQAIVRLIRERGITFINCAPSAFYPLIEHDHDQALASLRLVLLGGESIRIDTLKHWQQRYPRCELVNMYGPTECTDIASIYRITADDINRAVIPIGKPISNTQLHILDAQQQLVPIGAIGELHIGGAGLAKGYIGQPALTASQFIPNPFAPSHPSAKLYKTGDLVRYLPDGNIVYVGRSDHQVKIRGLRIELGEIENRLQKITGIKESLVVACSKPGNAQEQVLVAYYIADQEAPNSNALRHELLLDLPQYMIPSHFMALPCWPLNANGKIDRKALPEPDWSQLTRKAYVAPATSTQKTLAAIWSEVLGVNTIGINDSFFELGGHSLTATQALAKAQESFAVDIPLRQIFENPTIAAIAELIDQAIIEKSVLSAGQQDEGDSETFIL